MKALIEEINRKANNLEEICCGIRHHWKDYEDEYERETLIENIEDQLELFTKALDKLKDWGV